MHKRLTSVLLTASMLVAPATALAQNNSYATALGDPVLHWNAIALQAVAEDFTGTYGPVQQPGPGGTSRALAVVHAAIYDAVNSITRTHEPYVGFAPVPPNLQVSMDAAVAEAAHKTLSSLYPAQKSIFDAALKQHLAQIPKPQQVVGSMVGRVAAIQVLNDRRRDGTEKDASTHYEYSDELGRHQPDPVNNAQIIWGAGWGNLKPFTMESSSQFRAPPPPALTSQEYADAYNEVKDYGLETSTHRNLYQTEMGLYWAYDGVKKIGTPPRIYNQIARQIAIAQGNTVEENARLFALLNLAQADAGIASWESKFYYDFWRPIVAIRDTRDDGNPNTTPDPTWTPLGAPGSNQTGSNFTPPFPAYPSGHATFGSAALTTIAAFYGTDDISFTFMSDELNGITTDNAGNVRPASPRTYARLSDAIFENAKSRIYLGIHWDFDATEGIKMGMKIAEHLMENKLRPLGN